MGAEETSVDVRSLRGQPELGVKEDSNYTEFSQLHTPVHPRMTSSHIACGITHWLQTNPRFVTSVPVRCFVREHRT